MKVLMINFFYYIWILPILIICNKAYSEQSDNLCFSSEKEYQGFIDYMHKAIADLDNLKIVHLESIRDQHVFVVGIKSNILRIYNQFKPPCLAGEVSCVKCLELDEVFFDYRYHLISQYIIDHQKIFWNDLEGQKLVCPIDLNMSLSGIVNQINDQLKDGYAIELQDQEYLQCLGHIKSKISGKEWNMEKVLIFIKKAFVLDVFIDDDKTIHMVLGSAE